MDPHVLRYWESEFKIIRPHRSKSKQRLYRRKDVENLIRIRVLLHEEGYTISGARRILQQHGGVQDQNRRGGGNKVSDAHLAMIKQELQAILQRLQGD